MGERLSQLATCAKKSTRGVAKELAVSDGCIDHGSHKRSGCRGSAVRQVLVDGGRVATSAIVRSIGNPEA